MKPFLLSMLAPICWIFTGCQQPNTPSTAINFGAAYYSGFAYPVIGNLMDADGFVFDLTDPSSPVRDSRFRFRHAADTAIFVGDTLYAGTSNMQIISPGDTAYVRWFGPPSGEFMRSIGSYGSTMFLLHTLNDFAPDSQAFLKLRKIPSGDSIGLIPLKAPIGMALVGSVLYILDASTGLTAYDAANPVKQLANYPAINGYHIQAGSNNTLLIKTSAGIAQYSTAGGTVSQLSIIQ